MYLCRGGCWRAGVCERARSLLLILLYLLLPPFGYGSRLPQCGDATLCQCGIVAKANAVPLWQCASGARASCKHGAPVAAYGLALAFATMPRCHNVLVPHCRNRFPYPKRRRRRYNNNLIIILLLILQ